MNVAGKDSYFKAKDLLVLHKTTNILHDRLDVNLFSQPKYDYLKSKQKSLRVTIIVYFKNKKSV